MTVAQQFLTMQQLTPQACLVDLTPPTFAGITGLLNNPDGSVRASWSAATDLNGPISYEVFIKKGTATGLFAVTPYITRALFLDIYRDTLGAMLVQGETVHVGVRATDALGNENTNTATLSVVAAGLGYANLLAMLGALELESDALTRVTAVLAAISAIPVVTPPTAGEIADAVWDEAVVDHDNAGTFGLNAQTPAINASQVADAVWDAAVADHDDAGTFGLNAQSPGVNPTQVADAVWDALTTDHNDANSFGALVQVPVDCGNASDLTGIVDDSDDLLIGVVEDSDDSLVGVVEIC